MPNSEQPDGRDKGTRPPSLVARGERRRIERRLQEAGILCLPEVSLQYQTLAKRSVLRGVESGGAVKEIGRYVTFCDERGERLAWLQPIDSVGVNGRHAVVIALGLVSVEVFRVRNTYDVLIAKYDVLQLAESQRGRIEARVLFRGRQGHLPLDLTGEEKGMGGSDRSRILQQGWGTRRDPAGVRGGAKSRRARSGLCGCTHQHYLTAPKAAAKKTDAVNPVATGEPAAGVDAVTV